MHPHYRIAPLIRLHFQFVIARWGCPTHGWILLYHFYNGRRLQASTRDGEHNGAAGHNVLIGGVVISLTVVIDGVSGVVSEVGLIGVGGVGCSRL